MTFIWPIMLIWLLLVPLLVVVYLRLQRQRARLTALFGNQELAPAVSPHSTRDNKRSAHAFRVARRHIPSVLFLLALVILIIGLARPQTLVGLPRLEGTIILTFDVSGSMLADDLKPTRLEAAKAAARQFVQRQPSSVQIGVVAFSDGAFSTQAPTNQQAEVLAAIDRLTVQKGTSMARGIQASLAAISTVENPDLTLADPLGTPTTTPTPVPAGTYKSAVIVMLSDGENNQTPDPLDAAQEAANRGVRIYTVGIGSAEGALLKIDGFSVRSRLDEQTLRQISEITGGTYQDAESEEELGAVYDNLSPELVVKPQEMEVTSLFAGAGIFFLVIGSMLSLLWLGRLP
jgi:Ca-activated chloride channel homolog